MEPIAIVTAILAPLYIEARLPSHPRLQLPTIGACFRPRSHRVRHSLNPCSIANRTLLR